MQPLTVLRQQATAEEQRLQGLRAEAGQLQQAQAMRQRAATGGADAAPAPAGGATR